VGRRVLGSFLPHLFFKSGIIDPVFNLFIFLGIYLSSAAKRPAAGARAGHARDRGGVSRPRHAHQGPVGILVPVLCALVYWALGRFKTYLSIKGVAVAVAAGTAVAFSWYGVETLAHGPWFVTEFLKYQVKLFSSGEAGHGRPFWFHFVVLLFGCFPASFMAIRSFVPSRGDTEDRKRFGRWMVVLFWVVLVLFP